jgi:hypothetical protein
VVFAHPVLRLNRHTPSRLTQLQKHFSFISFNCFEFLEAAAARIYTAGNNADNGANKGPTAKHEKI